MGYGRIKGVALAGLLALGLSACSSPNNEMLLNLDDASFNQIVRNNFTEDSVVLIEKALAEKENRTHYIDVEDAFKANRFEFYREFSDAYNYTLVDSKGEKIASALEIDIDTVNQFIVDRFKSLDAFLLFVRNTYTDKESLLNWIAEQRWYMDKPEYDASHRYAEIMYINNIIDGVSVALEDDDIDAMTYEDLLDWLALTYQKEIEELAEYNREKIYMLNSKLNSVGMMPKSEDGQPLNLTERAMEELYIDYLSQQDFRNVFNSPEIELVNDRHVVTEETVEYLLNSGKVDSEHTTYTLMAYNKPLYIDVIDYIKNKDNDKIEALQSTLKLEYVSTKGVEVASPSNMNQVESLSVEEEVSSNNIIGPGSSIGPGGDIAVANEESEVKAEEPIEESIEGYSKIYKLTYKINGDTRSCLLETDPITGKFSVAKYDVYKFLNMKLY